MSSNKQAMPTTDTVHTSQHWLRNLLLAIALLAVLVAAAGAVYQAVSTANDRHAYPMPGQLVDIGGYKLHINCEGQGSPPVILDSGLGDSYISWEKVQPEIAKFTRVCSYDRAGLGYSDSSPLPRTSKNMAEELHALLHSANVSPPYVLVGHSLAGYNVRVYTSLYRSEVAGIVLVDSSHPEQQKRMPPELGDLEKSWIREEEFMEFSMPFGVPRILGFCGDKPAVRAVDCTFHSVRESVAELKSISISAAQAAQTGSLGDMPLAVLSEDPDMPQPDFPADLVKPISAAWQQMQEELSHLSTHSTHVIAKHSGHYIQLDRPELVIDAVKNIVQQAK